MIEQEEIPQFNILDSARNVTSSIIGIGKNITNDLVIRTKDILQCEERNLMLCSGLNRIEDIVSQ